MTSDSHPRLCLPRHEVVRTHLAASGSCRGMHALDPVGLISACTPVQGTQSSTVVQSGVVQLLYTYTYTHMYMYVYMCLD